MLNAFSMSLCNKYAVLDVYDDAGMADALAAALTAYGYHALVSHGGTPLFKSHKHGRP
ncbi:hypothetical protein AWB77_01455 [Caballeronia fortuita]|uniref:Uncharacterized protein n=2 Tax=Caballeronia fortuita TaxID=1777138 RepID=A0A158A7B0_9BURK|nr:hypothetical protein AWB77_01455 [Caballeronia fortuita]